MAIVSLFARELFKVTILLALIFVLPGLRSHADDSITKKDGTVISGQITGVSNGQVTMSSRTASGGVAKVPYYLSDVQSVSMAPPAEVAKAQGAAPAAVIAALEGPVKQYAGLPVDWVVNAMAQLAEAYAAAGQPDKSLALYSQISQLYPGSPFEIPAKTGKAKLDLQAGKVTDALAIVEPLVKEANKNLAPSQAEGGLYANAFLVYGQVLEALKRPQDALEAYLTVKTMFYQNAALADQADQLAKKLRDQNPGLGVD